MSLLVKSQFFLFITSTVALIQQHPSSVMLKAEKIGTENITKPKLNPFGWGGVPVQGTKIGTPSQGTEGYFCGKSDGFGAQLQCKFAALALARHEHKCYYHKPFSHRCAKPKETQSLEPGLYKVECSGLHERDMDADGLVGLKSDDQCRRDMSHSIRKRDEKDLSQSTEHKEAVTFRTVEEDPDAYYTPEVRAELRRMYDAAPGKKPPVEDCEVAVHVRRGDVADLDKNTRNPRCHRGMPMDKLYQVITSNFANKKVCVFSEGKVEDFEKINELQYVKFMLNGPAEHPFHNLVVAPELVIAKSSFSYSAALLNQGKVFYVERFWHKALSSWTQTKLDLSLAKVSHSPTLEESFCEFEPPPSEYWSDYD